MPPKSNLWNKSDGYVANPLGFQQFAEAIKQLGMFWVALNEPPPQAAARK